MWITVRTWCCGCLFPSYADFVMRFSSVEFLSHLFIWSLVENWEGLWNSNPKNQLHKIPLLKTQLSVAVIILWTTCLRRLNWIWLWAFQNNSYPKISDFCNLFAYPCIRIIKQIGVCMHISCILNYSLFFLLSGQPDHSSYQKGKVLCCHSWGLWNY